MPKTNVGVSLYYGGDWNSAPAYARDTITHTWGQKDEGGGITPSSCTGTLDNRDGRYLPDDARSSLYGLIGRNTPARVAIPPAFTTGTLTDTSDTFTRTSVDTWGTSTSGDTWTTRSVNGTILASDYQVAAGVGTMSVPAANALRMNYFASLMVTDFSAAVTMKAPQATGAELEIGGITFHGDASSPGTYAMVRVTAQTSNAVQISLRSKATATTISTVTVAGLTHTGTGQPLRVRVMVLGTRVLARVWIAANTEPTTWDLDVENSLEAPEPGFLGVRVFRASGNSNTSPVVFTLDNWESTSYVPVCQGAVTSWKPDRALKTDAWTAIEISGPAQRVNADKGVRSALTRTLSAPNVTGAPDAWWPMEFQDLRAKVPGTGAVNTNVLAIEQTRFMGAFFTADPPGPITQYTGPELEGTSSLVDLAAGASLKATPPYDRTATGYTIEWTVQGKATGDDPTLGFQMLRLDFDNGTTITGVGASTAIEIGAAAGDDAYLRIESFAGGTGTGHTGVPVYNDRVREYRMTIQQSGADVIAFLAVDGEILTSVTRTNETMGTLRYIWMNYPSGEGDSVPRYGQLRVWNSLTGFTFSNAGVGYRGETAADRFTRVCEEVGIVPSVVGDDTDPMGPQLPGTLANILEEIAFTDAGMIYDARGWYGLEFRTGRSLYNQTPVLELTYGEDVAPPLSPVTDDLGLTNSVTANRPNGITVVAQQTSGPNNINDPFDDPDGAGLVPTTLDANPETDADLYDVATWALALGTWKGSRYRNITVDLTARPQHFLAAMSIRPGDLITVEDLEADLVELIVVGGVNAIANNNHRATFNCRPAGPFRIGQVETSGYDRIGSSTSSLAAQFIAGTNTSMSVAVTGALWSTTAPPFHIKVGGVVFNVTAISGASSPQTFTVDVTPVNGVTRTIAAGAAVDVYPPIFIGL
jgi:hypothetical protein